MAGNEWINGYLEAILDAGTGFDESRPTVTLRERGNFNPTKYFVEEVVTGFDESDLHRTWIKVVATRNTLERNNRLENMCWRIWHLARRKKQIEWDDAQRLARRRIDREQGRRDATEDMSEDLSEGEKTDATGETNALSETPKRSFQRNFSDLQVWSDDNKGKRLYIVLISIWMWWACNCITRRIEAEELSLDAAELVITSTKQEIEEQWGLYDGFDVKLEKVLRARARRGVNCHGRYMPRMMVIPPGMDFSNVVVQEQEPAEADGDLAALISGDGNLSPRALPTIWSDVMRFFTNPHKPMILALSRPDPKKNLTTLLKAFGECRPLRELANLVGFYFSVGFSLTSVFSWPEHCRTYLSRIALCRMRHPQWQTDTPGDTSVEEESMGDSLKDVQDMSLRLSVDGERSSINGSLDNSGELEKLLAATGDPELYNQVKRVLNKLKQAPPSSTSEESEPKKHDGNEPKVPVNNTTVSNKFPVLRKRRRIFVIAVDCYDEDGKTAPRMLEIIQEIFKVVRSDTSARLVGFVLSTALTVNETLKMLSSGNIHPQEFDALICSSGSELYYPATPSYPDEASYISEKKLCPDPDYAYHIEYRWGGEGLRKTMSKLVAHEGDNSEKQERIIFEDADHSNAHCLSYGVKDSTRVPSVDEFRQRLRMRGLRCHLMYCRNSTQLHVIPLLASRSQALRGAMPRVLKERKNRRQGLMTETQILSLPSGE